MHDEQLKGVPGVSGKGRQVERRLLSLSLGIDVSSPRQKDLHATGSVPPGNENVVLL